MQKPLDQLLDDLRTDMYANVKLVAFNETTYPDLPNVTEETLEKMREFLTDKGHLVRNINSELEKNPLALLLYSILWKNGDRNKFEPILHGLNDRKLDKNKHKEDYDILQNVRKNSSYVFFQFGKHIRNRDEPIVDQHTVRAHKYLEFLNIEKSNAISTELLEVQRKKLESYNKVYQSGYLAYLDWVSRAIPTIHNPHQRIKLLATLDKVMFTLGKALSATNKKG